MRNTKIVMFAQEALQSTNLHPLRHIGQLIFCSSHVINYSANSKPPKQLLLNLRLRDCLCEEQHRIPWIFHFSFMPNATAPVWWDSTSRLDEVEVFQVKTSGMMRQSCYLLILIGFLIKKGLRLRWFVGYISIFILRTVWLKKSSTSRQFNGLLKQAASKLERGF